DLHGTLITDAGLVHLRRLTKLRELQLGHTRLTDAGLVNLERLTALRELVLENTEFTRAGAERLRRHLPYVEGLYGRETAHAVSAPHPERCSRCGAATFELLSSGGQWKQRGVSGRFWRVQCSRCQAVWAAYPSQQQLAAEQPLEWSEEALA